MFLELGVRPGDIVAFFLTNSPEFLMAWLGLWAIGCAPAMINFNLSGDALLHCLKVSGAKVMLVDDDDKIQARVAEEQPRMNSEIGITSVVLTQDLKAATAAKPIQRPDDTYREGVKPDFPSAIFYTSGTTGFPKGASLPTIHMHMVGAARSSFAGQKRGPGGDRWYVCMPMYHGTGGITGMGLFMSGISIAIGKGFSVRNFWRDAHDSESTCFMYVGETARYLLAAPPGPFDKNHKVRCMYGNGLRADVWEPFRKRFNVPEIIEFFNSSEGMLSLSNWNKGDYTVGSVGHHGFLMRAFTKNTLIPVAIDYESNEIVRDPKTGFARRSPYEQGGEILVRLTTKQSFPGYWNNPEATEKKLITDVFEKGDLFYRTGDALRRTDDGRWFFMDRLGDTYRWKSENVSTAEVAEALGRFPGVSEANVYGVQVPGYEGRAGCAALTISAEQRRDFDWQGLADAACKQLPRYAVPVFIRVSAGEVGAAASHNNKQDKVKLRAEGVDPGLKGTKVPGGEHDEMLWLPPKGNKYIPFRREDWQTLERGAARL